MLHAVSRVVLHAVLHGALTNWKSTAHPVLKAPRGPCPSMRTMQRIMSRPGFRLRGTSVAELVMNFVHNHDLKAAMSLNLTLYVQSADQGYG
eukprot:350658-Chlamydomonas_euryale.AAC.2